MSQQTAFLFPGQGSYLPGALAGLASESVVDALRQLDEVVVGYGHPVISPLLLDHHGPTLDLLLADAPERLQIAIFATSVGVAELLHREYGLRPDAVFGHSFGAVASLTSADVLTIRDGMRVVCERLEAFRQEPPPAGGMLALESDASGAARLIDAVGSPDLALAAENAPRQSVVSGPLDALRGLERAAQRLGVRTTWLRVQHAFHSPAHRGTARRFAEAIRGLPVRAPSVRCWSDVLGRCVTADDDIPELLSAQMVAPVRFMSTVRAMRDDGITRFLECGARDVLTRLTAACLPQATTVAALPRRMCHDELDIVLAPFTGATSESGPAGVSLPAEAQLMAELRSMYAKVLEYPEEVLTDDAEFEADLGIDSLRQNELLAQAFASYGLTTDDVRATEWPTLAAVASLLRGIADANTSVG